MSKETYKHVIRKRPSTCLQHNYYIYSSPTFIPPPTREREVYWLVGLFWHCSRSLSRQRERVFLTHLHPSSYPRREDSGVALTMLAAIFPPPIVFSPLLLKAWRLWRGTYNVGCSTTPRSPGGASRCGFRHLEQPLWYPGTKNLPASRHSWGRSVLRQPHDFLQNFCFRKRKQKK